MPKITLHMTNQGLIKISLVLFITTILLIFVIVTKDVLMPFCFSIFLSYLMYPLVWRLERLGIHRIISIMIVLLITITLLITVIFVMSSRISSIQIDYHAIKELFDTKVDSLLFFIESKFGVQVATIDDYMSDVSGVLFSSWQSAFGKLFSATTSTIFTITLLPVYIFLLLYYRTKTARFVFMLAGREKKAKALNILRQISMVTTKYMGGLLIVVFILAIMNTTGLYIIGVPHALLFGVFAACLNLIPYIGTFIGGLVPILYILFTYTNPLNTMIQVLILFIVVQSIEGNFLTPRIVGGNIKINALAIIIGLFVGNMVWGMAGMLIVVPVMAIMKIFMENFDELKPFAFLLSDDGVSQYEFKWVWFHKLKKKVLKLYKK